MQSDPGLLTSESERTTWVSVGASGTALDLDCSGSRERVAYAYASGLALHQESQNAKASNETWKNVARVHGKL